MKVNFKHGVYLHRLQYWPPWACTYWYRPDFFKGGDEWCNRSVGIGLGPLGTFVFFKPFGKLRDHDDGQCEPCRKGFLEAFPNETWCSHGWPGECRTHHCVEGCHPELVCGRCGKEPWQGYCEIDGQRYCLDVDLEEKTCYELEKAVRGG